MTTNREWLYSLEPSELSAWFDAEHVEHQERALDGDTATQDGDSRELILADLEKKTREWHDYDGNFMRIYSGVAYAQMKELLDRQAAITEEQTRCKWVSASADEIAAWRSKAEKLQAQVYELQAALDLISISLALPMASKPITPDMRKPEVLAKLIIETIKKLANEREHYRSKFSRALGYADDIHALMDEGTA